MSLNPYEPPQTTNDEPITDLSPAEALARHKEAFARELARQRLIWRLIAIVLAVGMTLLMLWPMLFAH